MSKEFNAGKVNQLNNGEMKAVKIDDDNKILLTKVNDEIFAIGANCTHYGAPLEKGVLFEDKIICPWHHACFQAKDGKLIEPPALNSLPQYEVKIKNDEITLTLPDKFEDSVIPQMSKRDVQNLDTYVIIGGGAAGNSAAQAIRETGFKGAVTIITQENRLPYDRPNLSKDYLAGKAEEEWMPLRSKEFYDDYDINILYQKKVTGIDKQKNIVKLENDEEVSFDKLLIATGGTPNQLDIPGSDLTNIFYLRSHSDCDSIIEAAKNKSNIVIIGASFIALETADSLMERLKASITVISKSAVPFKSNFGEEIGKMFKTAHEKNGITFRTNSEVKKFEGKTKVEKVILKNGDELDADLVIVGIGVKPATSFLKDFNLEDDGSLKVNEHLEFEKNIYAAGDIAKFPNSLNDEYTRIEHWRLAEQLGRIAGFNMAGKKEEIKIVPFFWTKQAGINLRYVGHAKDCDDIVTWGDISKHEFISFYYKDEKFLAAAGCNKDKDMDAIEGLLLQNKFPEKNKIKNQSVNLAELLM